jgi:hypothetical protein
VAHSRLSGECYPELTFEENKETHMALVGICGPSGGGGGVIFNDFNRNLTRLKVDSVEIRTGNVVDSVEMLLGPLSD